MRKIVLFLIFILLSSVAAAGQGDFAVVDSMGRSMHKFTSNGKLIAENVRFEWPENIAISSYDGGIIVNDEDSIAKLTPNGEVIFEINYLSGVKDVEVDPVTGDIWYIEAGRMGRIVKVNKDGGRELIITSNVEGTSWLTIRSTRNIIDNSEKRLPQALDINYKNGHVFVAYFDSIVEYDQFGNEIKVYDDFYYPRDIDVNSLTGHIAVADTDRGRVVILKDDKRIEISDKLRRPAEVELDLDDSVWVSEIGNRKIMKYNINGERVFEKSVSQPISLALNPYDGSIIFGSFQRFQSYIYKLDSNGNEIFVLGGFDNPTDIAIDLSETETEGNIYFPIIDPDRPYIYSKLSPRRFDPVYSIFNIEGRNEYGWYSSHGSKGSERDTYRKYLSDKYIPDIYPVIWGDKNEYNLAKYCEALVEALESEIGYIKTPNGYIFPDDCLIAHESLAEYLQTEQEINKQIDKQCRSLTDILVNKLGIQKETDDCQTTFELLTDLFEI